MFEGSYYRRMPPARPTARAWIFEGINDEIIGDFGLSGACSRVRTRPRRFQLGTPPNTLNPLPVQEAHQKTLRRGA